ncbi:MULTISPECIES: SDR family oxidoreductase [Streptomyces]|uniref:SDR family oxidoreductase n=1 Tax=Streptomyces TaxID=1883 RepID=UPI00163C22D6|nr:MULTISPECIES: SDR family oxidoreductase [Streptomyces]MBC2878671.1 SDR family oxidoreductase [Streptomyces sp. TYQ1024]UBI35117.1 SDR family oxidoreductase [Streptomyces mobaraensis]UKW27711.1 SDR family oxidoreductase [Streptomyces sp. TYQ1024]
MTRYGDRRAVVLGGTTGLGLAVAKRLVEGGARVLLTGRARSEELAAAAAELGPRARVVGTGPAGAAASPEALAPVVAGALGSVDFLFVHAGPADPLCATGGHGAPAAAPVRSACRTVRALLPLVHDGGAVVFTAAALPALALVVPSAPDGEPVAEADGGPWSCARSLATELADSGIRVNAVAPGLISLPGGGGAAGRVAGERVPMRRPGTVDEVARAALFLAAEATYTTGAELTVDGGLGRAAGRGAATGPPCPRPPDDGTREDRLAECRPPLTAPPPAEPL